METRFGQTRFTQKGGKRNTKREEEDDLREKGKMAQKGGTTITSMKGEKDVQREERQLWLINERGNWVKSHLHKKRERWEIPGEKEEDLMP